MTNFLRSYLNDKILKGFDKGTMTGKIPHDVLFQKIYAIGFLKHTVNWIKSHLSNRSFVVNLGNSFSEPASVSCGVPQGSV